MNTKKPRPTDFNYRNKPETISLNTERKISNEPFQPKNQFIKHCGSYIKKSKHMIQCCLDTTEMPFHIDWVTLHR